MDTKKFDVLVVGSGINSLVCAARLARAGKSVCVLERNDRLGGCIRTDEITEPGFVHDVLSGFHPLFITSPAYAELKTELENAGLEYVNSEYPTGVLMPDGRSLVIESDRAKNVVRLEAIAEGDGESYRRAMEEVEANARLTFALLANDLWNFATARLIIGEGIRRGPRALASYFGKATESCRGWLETNFSSSLVQALIAPWVLHAGLGPDAALSGFMGKVIVFTLEAAGMPIVRGGSYGLVSAFQKIIEDANGQLLLDADVDEILTDNGRAIGVSTSEGERYLADKGIYCSTTPGQLYLRLLRNADLPEKVTDQAITFRHGRADMQIHLALDAPPKWPSAQLARTAMVHLTSGIDGVARAVAQAESGLLPEEPTIVVGQPTVSDPGRAPEGKWILWIQLQELPRVIRGDAAGQITVEQDGSWTDTVREQYADRIIDRLARQLPGLRESILRRTVLSPKDLEALNMNLVGGDPYGGDCTLEQSFLWRPLKTPRNHKTEVRNLYHIGASTHPGPGLAGSSGYVAASYLLKK